MGTTTGTGFWDLISEDGAEADGYTEWIVAPGADVRELVVTEHIFDHANFYLAEGVQA